MPSARARRRRLRTSGADEPTNGRRRRPAALALHCVDVRTHDLGLALLAAAGLTLAALSAGGRLARRGDETSSRAQLERATPAIGRGGYLGSDACAACHPGEHATWAATYHRTMTQRATPTSVRAE
jgi:hypothetical protein